MKRWMILSVTAVLLSAGSQGMAGEWELSLAEDTSPIVRRHHAPVVQANWVFWGPKWKWAGAKLALRADKTLTGSVSALSLRITGAVTSPKANVLKYTFEFTADRQLRGIIGGGLEFRLKPDSPALGPGTPAPTLLDDRRGWTWALPSGGITVSLDRPAAGVYFERGNKSQIRVMLLGTELAKGTHRFVMTVTGPKGAQVAKSPADRYGPAETDKWHARALPHDASPVDVSFLNEGEKPAGHRGFVRARGEDLVFEDGTKARFWGGNIAAYAIFADKKQIAAQARRIASLGYNLMRIHHHDSTRWVGRTVIDKRRKDSGQLDAEVMDRLDWWIKCLRDEGVYVWLDLHVGRQFKTGDRIATGFEEIRRRGGEGKGFCYFNPRVRELMKGFNGRYLRHVNRYTKLAYKDDPAIMGLLITNENDLTHHFGNLMLGDKGNPVHNRIFTDAVKAFCAKTNLPPGKTAQTWVPGPSKIFLNDVEHRFGADVMAHLKTLGVRVPVSTTNYWGRMGLYGLPALAADSTIIDAHSYGGSEAIGTNPRYQANYIHWIAPAQVHGKPVAITEWNVPYPVLDRFTAPLYVAAVAALQGWDAPMIYNYSQRAFDKPTRAAKWSTFMDPAMTGIMPAAAVAFRQGHIAGAKRTYCLLLDRRRTYYQGLSPANCATIRTLAEQSKLTLGLPDLKELDWDRPTRPGAAVTRVRDHDRDFIPPKQTYVRSDTGQITRDWARGVQTIDTPKTQAVQGWLGEAGELKTAAATFSITTPKAVVALTSLDGKPLAGSGRILLTALGRAVAPGGRTPWRTEPVKGTIRLRSAADGLKLVPLGPRGEQLRAQPLKTRRGAVVIPLPPPAGTHWFLLKR